jgi:4-amino-4-deoxy-L-arabinose transferase-like glycosyltransferase
MQISAVADSLWGSRGKFRYLLIAAIILLFSFLGARELWTQEHRWADIVAGMFYRHDFLHPYLGNSYYYDKPLLSYWLVVVFAYFSDVLNTWALRLPSALSGLLAIWSIYRLGCSLKNKTMGLLAGWILLTTYYFVFWSRVSSADMLNLAGSLFAIAWYFDHRNKASFANYSIFFIIIALTSLCKGLVGAIIPFIAVSVDVLLQNTWKKYLRPSLFIALVPGLCLYLIPFLASAYFNDHAFGQNGLYLVYRENILRYFQPFDHQGPIYTYLIYLPLYLMPWTIFFIPALAKMGHWKTLSNSSKWIILTLAALFVFFSLSGSRRSYYVLPMVPFAILWIADWISDAVPLAKRQWWSVCLVGFSFVCIALALAIIPAWYYVYYGIDRFATLLKQDVSKVQPWKDWNVVILDGESKLSFYLNLPPGTVRYHIKGNERQDTFSQTQMLSVWPLLTKSTNTIYLTRKCYVPNLQTILTNHRVFEISYPSISFLKIPDREVPVAMIPRSFTR